jgi:hypothetical protein
MNNDHNLALPKPRIKRHYAALFSTLVLLSLIGTRLYFEPLQSAALMLDNQLTSNDKAYKKH